MLSSFLNRVLVILWRTLRKGWNVAKIKIFIASNYTWFDNCFRILNPLSSVATYMVQVKNNFCIRAIVVSTSAVQRPIHNITSVFKAITDMRNLGKIIVSVHFQTDCAEPNYKSFKGLRCQVKKTSKKDWSNHKWGKLIPTVPNSNIFLELIGPQFYLK